jgi:hypothetical protein
VNRQVERLVRLLDVQAAHAHAREPFVAARFEVEHALMALHKLRTRMGSPAEVEAGKAWLRSQELTGLFEAPLL